MNQYKILVVGDTRVGKTVLIEILKAGANKTNQQPNSYRPTEGCNCTFYSCKNETELYIVDTSGSLAYRGLVKLHMQYLGAIIIVCSLNEPKSVQSLKEWYKIFEGEFRGNSEAVLKFVVVSKLETKSSRHPDALHIEAKTFAQNIGAEFHTISAVTVHELFTSVSEKLLRKSSLSPTYESSPGDACDSSKTFYVDDILVGESMTVKRFPDPLLVDTKGMKVSHLKVCSSRISFTNAEGQIFGWRPTGSKFNDLEGKATKSMQQNPLFKCIESQEPVTLWQHEWLLEDGQGVGLSIRRQPTAVNMLKGIKSLAIRSLAEDCTDFTDHSNLFYKLQHTDDNKLQEIGFNLCDDAIADQPELIKSVFTPTPKNLKCEVNGALKVTSYSLSNSHVYAVLEDGTVMFWGYKRHKKRQGSNDVGHQNPAEFSRIPKAITTEGFVTQVACGLEFTLILTREGTVFSSGRGKFGSLGQDDTKDRSQLTQIKELVKITAIGAGYYHSTSLGEDGSVYLWGKVVNTIITKPWTPVPLQWRWSTWFTSIECGAYHTLFVDSKRAVYSLGRGMDGALGSGHYRDAEYVKWIAVLKSIKLVSAGTRHSAFLTDDGTVYTCGSNKAGQLGYFTSTASSSLPKKVYLGKNPNDTEIRAQYVICSQDSTTVITDDNRTFVWGKFDYGPNVMNSLPLQGSSEEIIDVTTCTFPGSTGEFSCELIMALTSASTFVLCAGVTSGSHAVTMDYQHMPWPGKAVISGNVRNVVRAVSVGACVVVLDNRNECYCTDMAEWVKRTVDKAKNRSSAGVMYNICCAVDMLSREEIPSLEFLRLDFEYSQPILQVEASMAFFLFRSAIGDVFSWNPYSGTPVRRHSEMDDKVVVQIACGRYHFAALTNAGILLTRGIGCHGQLGHGDVKSRGSFEMVPLCKIEHIQSVYCGEASTAVISTTGEVYFWGQLSVLKQEKFHRKQKILQATIESVWKTQLSTFISHEVKQEPTKIVLTKTPFEFSIEEKVASIDGAERVLRVKACSSTKDNADITKGTVSRQTQNTLQVSMTFHTVQEFEVSVTSKGQHVTGSPFPVKVEEGVPLKTYKMSLIGCSVDSLRTVAAALKEAFATDQDHPNTLVFPFGARVQLWGAFEVNVDQKLFDTVALSTLTDGGIFLYVWDASFCDFPRENLNFWLNQCAVKAPLTQVVLLGVSLNSGQLHSFHLETFQRINPNLTKFIFIGLLERLLFVREIQRVIDERIFTEPLKTRCVWSKFVRFQEKLREKSNRGAKVMNRQEFVCLADECEIEGESRIQEAVRYLERVGLALNIGDEDIFLVLDQSWLSEQLYELSNSCPQGAVNTSDIEQPKSSIIEMLIRKNLAFKNASQARLFFVPCLPANGNEESLNGEEWSNTVRHITIDCAPHHLYTAVPVLMARLSSDDQFDVTNVEGYSCVLHDGELKCRIDFGPCLVDNNKFEIRFYIYSKGEKSISNFADSLVESARRHLAESLSSAETRVMVSCRVCRMYYFDLEAMQQNLQAELTCRECKATVQASDLVQGCRSALSKLPQLMKEPLTGRLGIIPASPPPKILTASQIVQPLICSMEKHNQQILEEMSSQFENMARFFSDLKEFDVPRTFCLLPDLTKQGGGGDFMAIVKRSLLTYKQQQFRLHLMCEGNGDGTGIHFLEPDQHKGYEISDVNEFLLNTVGHLRMVLKLVMKLLPLLPMAVAPGIFATTTAVSSILGNVVVKVAEYKVDQHLQQIDKFLMRFEDTADTITQPKHLGNCQSDNVIYKTADCDYKMLRNILKSFERTDNFGGLRQEYRKDNGAVWVCKDHRKYIRTTQHTIETKSKEM